MNFAEAMQGVPHEIAERQCVHRDKAAPAFGAGIRAALAKLAAGSKAAE
ncbi:MAG: hypothetical protein V3R90_16875 [Limibaculum sp.]